METAPERERCDEHDGFCIPFSLHWTKQLQLESQIFRKDRALQQFREALTAKEEELQQALFAKENYRRKYIEWKETCKALTNNHHREARELAFTFATEERNMSALIARLPLSQRRELGELIVREYDDMFESTPESADCAESAADTSCD